MNWFQQLLGFIRRSPRASPEPPKLSESSLERLYSARTTALKAVRSRLRLRKSQDRIDYLGGVTFNDTPSFSGFPGDHAARLIGVLRWLAQFDPDMNSAIRDFIVLANPGHSVTFQGTPKAVRAAEKEFDRWVRTLYQHGGGLNGLCNNQIREAIFGASSLEWYPQKNKRGVQDIAIVTHSEVRIRRDNQDRWHFYQVGFGEEIELDPTTYHYVPLQTDGSSPYGVPLMLGAIQATEMHHKAIASLDRVLGLMAKAVLLHASIPVPTQEEMRDENGRLPSQEEYELGVEAYHQNMAELIINEAEQGLLVTPQGTQITVTSLAKSAEGYPAVLKSVERLKFTGMRTLNFLRNSVETTTEALAKIQYPIVESEAWNLARVVAEQMEFGVNLHMRLAGIPVTCHFEFEQAPSAFAEDEANTESTKVSTLLQLFNLFPKATRAKIEQALSMDLTEDLKDREGRQSSGNSSQNDMGQEEDDQASDEPVTVQLMYHKKTGRYAKKALRPERQVHR